MRFTKREEIFPPRKPKKAIEYGVKNLEICFDDISNPNVEKITHICCGYPDKLDAVNYPKAPLDSYHQIAELLDKSIIDSISLEDAHRFNDLSLLNKFKQSKIILGVINIASSKEETINEVQNRVKDALKHIDEERLIVAPDCGLGHLSRELAMKKLKTMVTAVEKI